MIKIKSQKTVEGQRVRQKECIDLSCLGMALKAPPPEECLAGTLVALGSRFTPDLQAEI